MHIILLKFGPDKKDAPNYMDAHNAWIAKGLEDEIFQIVGSLDVGGGFILAHGEDDKMLKERIAQDPFVAHNIVTVEQYHIDVKHTQPELKYLMAG